MKKCARSGRHTVVSEPSSSSMGREHLGVHKVVILGKPGCHLCDLLEAEVRSVLGSGTDFAVLDIEKDPILHDAYWLRIPVLKVGEREVFEAKMMDPDGEWRRLLPSLLQSS